MRAYVGMEFNHKGRVLTVTRKSTKPGRWICTGVNHKGNYVESVFTEAELDRMIANPNPGRIEINMWE